MGKDKIQCSHPAGHRVPKEDSKYILCTLCGSEFIPRPSRAVLHGTNQGYKKHDKVRFGEWDWPACRDCVKANTDYRNTLPVAEKTRENRANREKARSRALQRLLRLYPHEYARLYAEEYMLLEDNPGTIPRLEREIGILLRAGKGQGSRAAAAERQLAAAVRGSWATPEEIKKWAQVNRLRHRIEELREQRGEPALGG